MKGWTMYSIGDDDELERNTFIIEDRKRWGYLREIAHAMGIEHGEACKRYYMFLIGIRGEGRDLYETLYNKYEKDSKIAETAKDYDYKRRNANKWLQ